MPRGKCTEKKQPYTTGERSSLASVKTAGYEGVGASVKTAGHEEEDQEAMECERWGEDAEVEMDVDVSVEEELQFLTEICHTRSTLTPPTNSTSHLHPLASTACYTVSIYVTNSHSESTSCCLQEKLYVVLDTNVLISHLNFLVELKDYAIKGVGRPLLVIPWAVMQELDALKTCSAKVGDKANKAIAFLHDCFSAGHPRVRGQTMEEVGGHMQVG